MKARNVDSDYWERYEAERKEAFAILDRFLVKHYGERCSDTHGGCATCSAWAVRDALHATIQEWG